MNTPSPANWEPNGRRTRPTIWPRLFASRPETPATSGQVRISWRKATGPELQRDDPIMNPPSQLSTRPRLLLLAVLVAAVVAVASADGLVPRAAAQEGEAPEKAAAP